jgi:hypothetical protein
MCPNSRSIVAFCVLALYVSVSQAARVPVQGEQTVTAVMTADGIPYDVPLLHRQGPPPGRPNGPPFDPPGPPADPLGPPFDPPGPPEEHPGHYVVGYVDDFGNEVESYTISRAGEWACEIKGVIDPDPAHDFTNTVTDIGAPSTFTFTVTSPMLPPIGFPNSVNASLVGGLTDLTSNGVSVTPVAPNTHLLISQVGVPLTSMGVDVGLAESGIGTYGPYTAGPIPGPGPGPWTTLNTTLSFTLSGGGDTFAYTLHSEIVPEPSSFLLAGIGGLAALGFAIRRRKAA